MLPVDTNQPVLGLRVGVGFKRNLKGRQKKVCGGGGWTEELSRSKMLNHVPVKKMLALTCLMSLRGLTQ